jgi:hypothetical protein
VRHLRYSYYTEYASNKHNKGINLVLIGLLKYTIYKLTEYGLYQALEYVKSIDEDTGSKIIERFQIDQAALAQTIFGIFPTVISEENHEMSCLSMSLCFDVLLRLSKSLRSPYPLKKICLLTAWKTSGAFRRKTTILDQRVEH